MTNTEHLPTFIQSSDVISETSKLLANILNTALEQKQHVVLFLSGGSAIAVLPKLQELLDAMGSLDSLTVTLVDERYGEPEHADSNEQQIRETGFIDWLGGKGGHWISVLTGQEKELEAKRMNQLIEDWMVVHSIFIGLFGAGEDFHTASEMPTQVEGEKYDHTHGDQEYYSAITLDPSYPNPYQHRLGLTPKAILLFDFRVLALRGNKKLPIIEKLHSPTIDTDQFPVQILQDEKTVVVWGE